MNEVIAHAATFVGQKTAGNSRSADTGIHGSDITGNFGTGTIDRASLVSPPLSSAALPMATFMRPRLSSLSHPCGRRDRFYNACHGARFDPPTGM
jgi:hypothetical protein